MLAFEFLEGDFGLLCRGVVFSCGPSCAGTKFCDESPQFLLGEASAVGTWDE